MQGHKFENVDEYISSFPLDIQNKLEELRQLIKLTIPTATECISYNMPAYKEGKVLVYFAGYMKHIGFYPTANGISTFIDELSDYKTSKGAIQFPINKPYPEDLIRKIVLFRHQYASL